MVSTIILFIKADRAGDWNLHLSSFKEMLPLMMLYDHINYARWGAVYLLDMLQLEEFKSIELAQEVHAEFITGNFVVKGTAGSLNISKMAGNSFNESGTHADLGDKRIARGEAGVKKLVQQIQLFNPIGRTCEELIFISTNDVASNEIKNDILSVTMRSSELLTNLTRLVIFTIRSPKTDPKHLLI